MTRRDCFGWCAILLASCSVVIAADVRLPSTNTVRIAAAQAARRVVDFRLDPDAAMAAVETNLTELVRIIKRAGEAQCDALVLPEDTPGLLNWSS